MRNLYALTKREICSLFLAPSLHLVTAFFVLLYGAGFVASVFQEQLATFDTVALFVTFCIVLLVPLITMRSFAEETSSGTIELLLTSPVSAGEVVLSKWLSTFVFYCAGMLPLLGHVFLLDSCGRLDWGATVSSFLGLFLTGGLLAAIGVFISSLTSSQIVAAAAAVVANFILFSFDSIPAGEGALLGALKHLSFWTHMKNGFVLGRIDSSAIIYFLTFPVGILFVTWLRIGARGTLSRVKSKVNRKLELLAGALFVAAILTALADACWLNVKGFGLGDLYGSFAKGGDSELLSQMLLMLLAAGLLAASAVVFHSSRAEGGGGWKAVFQADVMPTVLGAVAATVILINVNYLSTYPFGVMEGEGWPLKALTVLQPKSWDMTENAENTLSVDTRKTIDELSGRVDITVFFSARMDYKGVDLLGRTQRLLQKYSNYSSLIRVEYIDAELERARAIEMGKKLDLNTAYIHQLAVASYEGRRTLIPAGLLLQPPQGQAAAFMNKKEFTFAGEDGFTRSLKRLLDPRTTRVYFTSGHGEYSIASTEMKPRLAGKFAGELGHNMIEVKNLFFNGPIPQDCDVLILAGPEIPLGKSSIEELESYIARGGRIMLLLPSIAQPVSGNIELTPVDPELNALMKSWGGVPRQDTVLDRARGYGRQPTNVQALASNAHPISRGGRTVLTVLPSPQSFREYPNVNGKNWQMQRLLVSTESAVSRLSTAEGWKHRSGPLTLAFTSARPGEDGKPEARVVVVGNCEFISNLSFDVAHNKALAVSAVQWLAGRDYNIRVESPEFVDRTIKLDAPQQYLIAWVCLLWLPLIWVVLATVVWRLRKQ